jgi:predicted outer membrane repeat protein
VSKSNVTNNNAKVTGGGIYVSDSARLNLTDSRLVGNAAQTRIGGGMGIWSHAKVRVAQTLIADNVADEDGGAISVGDTSSLILLGTAAHNNSASTHGGALFIRNASRVIIHDSRFMHIRLGVDGQGGALGVLGPATVSLTGCLVENNTAKYAGGKDVAGGATVHMVATNMTLLMIRVVPCILATTAVSTDSHAFLPTTLGEVLAVVLCPCMVLRTCNLRALLFKQTRLCMEGGGNLQTVCRCIWSTPA